MKDFLKDTAIAATGIVASTDFSVPELNQPSDGVVIQAVVLVLTVVTQLIRLFGAAKKIK